MNTVVKNRLNSLLANTLDLALKRRAKEIVKSLNLEDGDKVLDVGCGDGYYLHLLSNLGLKLNLMGMDYDKKALLSAGRNLKSEKIRLYWGDLMKKLPFKTNSFDKVVMSEVLEHLPDDAKGLKEVKRILKKGGRLILSVPNKKYPFLWDPINWTLENIFSTHIKNGFWAGIWNQHERLYSIKQFERVIKKSGLKILKTEVLTFWSLPFNHYIINFGARILANKSGSVITKGASKFSISSERSLIPKLYFSLSNTIDSLNNYLQPRYQGVSIVAVAGKL